MVADMAYLMPWFEPQIHFFNNRYLIEMAYLCEQMGKENCRESALAIHNVKISLCVVGIFIRLCQNR